MAQRQFCTFQKNISKEEKYQFILVSWGSSHLLDCFTRVVTGLKLRLIMKSFTISSDTTILVSESKNLWLESHNKMPKKTR